MHRRRKFIPSSNLTTNNTGYNHSSPEYSFKYPDRNINVIGHLFSEQIYSPASWGSDLRTYKIKKRTDKDKGK